MSQNPSLARHGAARVLPLLVATKKSSWLARSSKRPDGVFGCRVKAFNRQVWRQMAAKALRQGLHQGHPAETHRPDFQGPHHRLEPPPADAIDLRPWARSYFDLKNSLG